jgi:hypothetical protein
MRGDRIATGQINDITTVIVDTVIARDACNKREKREEKNDTISGVCSIFEWNKQQRHKKTPRTPGRRFLNVDFRAIFGNDVGQFGCALIRITTDAV